jgi:membrane-associated phospholipid phosphatase
VTLLPLRLSEWILAAWFFYAIGIASWLPVDPGVKALITIVNLALFAAMVLIARRDRAEGDPESPIAHIRDWFPVPMILLAYREMGWVALPHTDQRFEDFWISIDHIILVDGRFKDAVEFFGWPIPALLELAYLLVYVAPILCVALFYVFRRRERLDAYYSILLAGTLSAYACYPFFPSDPPRTVYPNAHLPIMTFLRSVNLWIVGGYGIHTSVFPSGHSAAAFASAFAMFRTLPERRMVNWGVLTPAVLIAIGSFYGRYHYAIDAAAGFAMALLAWGASFIWGWSPSTRSMRSRISSP